ncbi:SAM-dependent methyltransferase, partial [Niveispirillum sp.]|uniref:SAM-dependent methyltransferase n=1 Tax=Niveispirillum sp. TaxID=1917217 RepID=UPI001B6A4A66
MPNSIDVSKPLVSGQTHGSLTVVGTGIRSISHFTQEAIGHIRDADAVFYSVPDGVTASFIRELNPVAFNLSMQYGEGKRRQVTYVQMAELILRAVREGKRVTAVFYGHPGFFVSPIRRALSIARKEGHRTEMLPGISSTDYLFADLRVDPSVHGCQILEASDMLLRNRPVVTSSHVVLLQIGSVGDVAYSAKGFVNNKRDVLFNRLIELYGENHPCYYYLGATFPGLESQIIRRPLKAYRDPAVRATIHSASSLYLPPKDILPVDPDMAERLGMHPPGVQVKPAGDKLPPVQSDYGPFEMEAVARIDRDPPTGRERRTNKALYRILSQLAGSPHATEAFRADPAGYVSLFSGLTQEEKNALSNRSAAALHGVSLQVVYGGAVTPAPVVDTPVPAVKADAAEDHDATEQNDAAEDHDATEQNDAAEDHDATEDHASDAREDHDATEQNDAAEDHDATEDHASDAREDHDATEDHTADAAEDHDATEDHTADAAEDHDATEDHT